ncbi:MAG: acyl-CoA reductase [Flavobacteriales bacterium]|nr:acyl-CoA reductase [Flavobacteriales bacterium]
MSTGSNFPKESLDHLHGILKELTNPSAKTAILTDEQVKKFSEAKFHSQSLNPWFTEKNIDRAIEGLAEMTRPKASRAWIGNYETSKKQELKIGLILAGNIPLVGFHDILSVLVAGHKAKVKLSGQDRLLLPLIFKFWSESIGADKSQIEWLTDRKLKGFDAVIATGSNNTSRYFEYYFGKYPHIIRKNRNSVAVLTGNESEEEMKLLGEDIFSYFGLGCRNVAKLFVKDDFDMDRFFKSIYEYSPVINHNKYANNYDYYKALWLMNQEDLLDNGFLLVRHSEAMSSPIGTVFYERYSDESLLGSRLKNEKERIQCVVSSEKVPFGKSQKPELWDYADGVDTMEFLLNLKK